MPDTQPEHSLNSLSKGYVVAFHNDEKLHGYLGLSCKERARTNIQPAYFKDAEYGNIVAGGSLEEGVRKRDAQVLQYIARVIKEGHHVFLDYKVRDAETHNEDLSEQYFKIASIGVIPTPEASPALGVYNLLNLELFDEEDRREIEILVFRSQGGLFRSVHGFSPLVRVA